MPDADESSIVLKALMDINLPKFIKNDIPLFEHIISDLFPHTTALDSKKEDLLDAIDGQLDLAQYFKSDNIRSKI